MVSIDSGLGETRVFQHYFFSPRKLTELTHLISVSLHRPSPASCKSLMFRQVRGCGRPSPSPVLFSLFPSSFCWLKIFVRTLGARGGKEVASAGSPHSAPSPRRETGLIAGRRSKSPSLPRKAGRGCWAVGHRREGHGGEVGWAWDPVLGGSRAGLDVLGSAWESEPFSVVSWLHPCSGLARARGGVSGAFSKNKFSGEQAGWSWQREGSEPQELEALDSLSQSWHGPHTGAGAAGGGTLMGGVLRRAGSVAHPVY